MRCSCRRRFWQICRRRGGPASVAGRVLLPADRESRATPVMIGFRDALERDFFEGFIQVASIGPRTAVKAIALPIPMIAAAIESGDTRVLTRLPGVGTQKAREIVAKLQGKMSAYLYRRGRLHLPCLLVGPASRRASWKTRCWRGRWQLQYTRNDAVQMIPNAPRPPPLPRQHRRNAGGDLPATRLRLWATRIFSLQQDTSMEER